MPKENKTEYEKTVEYLKSYQQMYYRLEFINSQIAKVKSPGAHPEGTGPVKDINDYLDEKTSILESMERIEELIARISDIKVRYVLAYRFLQFKTLEEITGLMGYSPAQIYRYYKKGVNMIGNDI